MGSIFGLSILVHWYFHVSVPQCFYSQRLSQYVLRLVGLISASQLFLCCGFQAIFVRLVYHINLSINLSSSRKRSLLFQITLHLQSDSGETNILMMSRYPIHEQRMFHLFKSVLLSFRTVLQDFLIQISNISC